MSSMAAIRPNFLHSIPTGANDQQGSGQLAGKAYLLKTRRLLATSHKTWQTTRSDRADQYPYFRNGATSRIKHPTDAVLPLLSDFCASRHLAPLADSPISVLKPRLLTCTYTDQSTWSLNTRPFTHSRKTRPSSHKGTRRYALVARSRKVCPSLLLLNCTLESQPS